MALTRRRETILAWLRKRSQARTAWWVTLQATRADGSRARVMNERGVTRPKTNQPYHACVRRACGVSYVRPGLYEYEAQMPEAWREPPLPSAAPRSPPDPRVESLHTTLWNAAAGGE